MDKKQHKRPRRDVNTIAASIVRQATGPEPKRPPPREREDAPEPKEKGEG
ncbi:MAG TPA: hypothetical protein VFQ39_20120 [Longimicrobium sp.]|nr:hypothetical protein [Longimicrobium sp.]